MRSSEKAVFFAFWIVPLASLASVMELKDPDLWGHILYGMDHLDTGSLSRVDTYSYTAPNAPWINHEWLAELLFALSWNTAGAAGLWAVRLVLVGATLAIVLRLIRETTAGIWPGLIIYNIAIYGMATGFAVRPQLFTFFFFPVLLFLIHRVYIQRTWSPWWALAFGPVMAIWANLHGGFLVGLALLSWLLICILSDGWRDRTARWQSFPIVFGIALAFAATLMNPYGADLWRWLGRSLLVSRADRIAEWVPVHKFSPQFVLVGFYLTLGCTAFLFFASRAKKNLFEWGLLFAMAPVAWMNTRHGVLFCEVAAIVLPKHLESILPRLTALRSVRPAFAIRLVAICTAYAVAIHLLPMHRPTSMPVKTSVQPYNAMKFIHDNELRGNAIVWFDWAQAAIWHLHGSCKVAFDGRFRTVYPQAVEDDYTHFHDVDGQWMNLIDRYDTHMVLMPADWPGVEGLSSHDDWLLVYESSGSESMRDLDQESENAVLLIRRGIFPAFESRWERGEVEPAESLAMFRFGMTIGDPSVESDGSRSP